MLMLLSAVIGVQTSSLVFGKMEDPLLDRIFEESGLSNLGTDPKVLKTMSQDPDQAFEHLYLFMLQNVRGVASQAAIEEMSQAGEFSVADLEKILLEDDIAYLQKKEQFASLDQAFTKWVALSAQYKQEMDFFSLNRQLAIETLSQELFYNGNLDDSAGIDLLDDVEIIHKIIFKTPLQVPERSGNQTVALSSEEPEVFLSAEESVFPLPEDEAYSCYDEVDVRDALDSYDEQVQADGGATPSQTFTPQIPPDPDTEFKEFLERVETGEEPVTVDQFENFLETFTAQKGSFKRELPCNDIFCLEINLVTGSIGQSDADNPYLPTDNCIACHVTYIRERMEDTLSEPLGANKVSSAWFEEATCKEAGKHINLDLNLRAVPKPILQDSGDDVDEKPAQNVEGLRSSLESVHALPSGPEDIMKNPAEVECEGLVNVAGFSGGGGLQDTFEQCQEATENYDNVISDTLDGFIFNVKAQSDSLLVQQLVGELSAMRTLFESFENALSEAVEPLDRLVNKPYCE